MDLELSQLDKVYLSDLANYNRTLNQRNRLLKDAYYRDDILDTLDVWDMQLVQYGEKIIQRRLRFIEEVNAIIGDIHHKLTGGRERISLSYEPGCGALSLETALEKNRERDIRMKSTSVGPHRDDICFMAGGIDIRRFGSQGQQRTAALSLKLAEIELVKRAIKDTPAAGRLRMPRAGAPARFSSGYAGSRGRCGRRTGWRGGRSSPRRNTGCGVRRTKNSFRALRGRRRVPTAFR